VNIGVDSRYCDSSSSLELEEPFVYVIFIKISEKLKPFSALKIFPFPPEFNKNVLNEFRKCDNKIIQLD